MKLIAGQQFGRAVAVQVHLLDKERASRLSGTDGPRAHSHVTPKVKEKAAHKMDDLLKRAK